jgi:hypothetical protein
MLRALLIAVIVSLSLPAAAQDAHADKATARTLFQDAGVAMEAQDYARATDLYARANALFPAPTSALGEARALVKLGRLVEASERYLALMNKPLGDDASEAFTRAVDDARSEREVVLERLPALLITREEGGGVSLDGKPLDAASLGVKRWVDPGKHRITVHVEGADDITREVEVTEGQVLPIDLTGVGDQLPPEPEAAEAPRDAADPPQETSDTDQTQRNAGFSLIGVGGASIVVAIITGAAYLDATGTIDDQCDDQLRCTQAGLDAVDRGETLGIVNAVTLIGGIALVAAGVTLVLTSPDQADPDEEQVALHPLLAPTAAGLGVSGRF